MKHYIRKNDKYKWQTIVGLIFSGNIINFEEDGDQNLWVKCDDGKIRATTFFKDNWKENKNSKESILFSMEY